MKTFEFILLVIAVCITGVAMAQTMTVTTGHGYFTYNGQPTSYYDIMPGTYPLDNELNYVETNGASNVQLNYTAEDQYLCTRLPNQPGC